MSPSGARMDAPLSRWPLNRRRLLIALVHGVLVVVSYGLAYLLRFEGSVPPRYAELFWDTLPLLLMLRLASFAAFQQFGGWWRHVGIHDLARLVKSVSLGSILFLTALFLIGDIQGFSRSVLLLDWGICLALLGGARLSVRLAKETHLGGPASRGGKRTLILGAGSGGANLVRQVWGDPKSDLHPIGFLDDDPLKQEVRIHGVPVLGTSADLDGVVQRHSVELVVIAISSATRDQMRRVVEACTDARVDFKIVPSVRELVDGKARLTELRKVQISDLLGRPPVSLDLSRVDQDLRDQVVLITGAAGSIGSELSRQVAAYGPAKLIMLDQAESPLFFLNNELGKEHPDLYLIPVVGDVTDAPAMDRIFARHRPTHVFHAAAYKHVPLMEDNIREAVRTNVGGSFTIAALAGRHRSRKFVLISTDKAVHPSSVMGATKRIAERVVLESAGMAQHDTDYRAVRFGNVLGSHGSVIPIFQQQIAEGGPVTVTHKEVSRYFMTIPEATQLVLQAAAIPAAAGRVCMLDMGEPVKIVDLAENLIRLSGLEPYTEMPIVFTGLRPGEKLHEELLRMPERAVPTEVQKIRIVEAGVADALGVSRSLSRILDPKTTKSVDQMLMTIREMVPECTSPLRERTAASAAQVIPVPDGEVSGVA